MTPHCGSFAILNFIIIAGSLIMGVIVGLKFIHYLSIFVAGGIGIGGAVIQSAHVKAKVPPAPHVGRAMRVLGLLALIAIVALWVTGFGLAYSIYGTMNIGTAFNIKLLGATALLVASSISNFHLHKAMQAQVPPNAKLMKIMMSVSRVALVLVFVGIAITTTTSL
jgi:hypothetical protein